MPTAQPTSATAAVLLHQNITSTMLIQAQKSVMFPFRKWTLLPEQQKPLNSETASTLAKNSTALQHLTAVTTKAFSGQVTSISPATTDTARRSQAIMLRLLWVISSQVTHLLKNGITSKTAITLLNSIQTAPQTTLPQAQQLTEAITLTVQTLKSAVKSQQIPLSAKLLLPLLQFHLPKVRNTRLNLLPITT